MGANMTWPTDRSQWNSLTAKGFLGLLSVLSLLATASCATDSEYQEASHDAETTRVQLEATKAESASLEQQLKTLETELTDLTTRSQALSEELEHLRESQADEQLAFDEAVGKMHQAVMTLKAQNRTMKQAYDEQQKENIALASLVQRYSRELEELQAADSRPVPPAPTAVPAVAQIPAQGIQPNGHSMTAAPTPPSVPPAPLRPTPPPVTTPPVEEGWLDMFMRWMLWLWHLVF